MISMLQNWKGTVEVNGTTYDNIVQIPSNTQFKDGWCIKLHAKQKNANLTANTTSQSTSNEEHEVRITVKQYMTKKASPEFDFMQKWNNDNPMPMCMMTGKKIKETRGMVYMELHGDMYAEKMCTCMQCGRKLTNPVSQYFGVGPECGGHMYANPFDSDEELKEAVAEYKKQLREVRWTGWIIKSAIKEEVQA